MKPSTHPVYPTHIALTEVPKNMAAEDHYLFSKVLSLPIQSTVLLKLSKVYILKQLIFDWKGRKFYTEHTSTTPVSGTKRFKRLFRLLLPQRHIPKAVWITNQWTHAYFHWLTDALPRLVAAQPFLDDHVVVLPKKYERAPFVLQSLDMLNVKALFFGGFEKQQVGELLLPSHTGSVGHYNNTVMNVLRDKFLQRYQPLPPATRKIYVSRQKATKRKILNEAAVVEVMLRHGYEIHYFEDYDFEMQVRLCLAAKCLVGIHGAGLSNMLFMQPQGRILELRNAEDDLNNCFFTLASSLAHDYYYLNNAGDNKDTHVVNITVNTTLLENVLITMEEA